MVEALANSGSGLPLVVRWNFLLSSVYAGLSADDIEKHTLQELLIECGRRDIHVHCRARKHDVVCIILDFIKNKGIGHVPAKQRAGVGTIRREAWQTGINPGGKSVWKLGELMRERDESEAERSKLSTDPNLPHMQTDTHRPKIVIVCSRDSSDDRMVPEVHLDAEHAKADRLLTAGIFLSGLEEATCKHVHVRDFTLIKPLPLERGNRSKEHGRSRILETLEYAHQGTQILLVAIGVDGIPCNVDGWRDFVDRHQVHRATNSRPHLIISEREAQWVKNRTLWSWHDWQGPFQDRFWAYCDLWDLRNVESGVRLYEQIRTQWESGMDERMGKRHGIKREGRSVNGRSGTRRSSRPSSWGP